MSDEDENDYRHVLPAETPEHVTIPVTFDMMKAARLLRRRLPQEQYDWLFESIVSLAGDELEVESTLTADDADESPASGSGETTAQDHRDAEEGGEHDA